MRVAVFEDPAFRAMPTYGAADASAALEAAGHGVTGISASGLAALTRAQADVLVLPYVEGTFAAEALAGLVAFHAAGGGLVVLGDLPHQGAWYPYRNMEAWRLRMTRGSGPFRIDGLSASGKRVLGWDSLPDAGFFEGRTLSALRATAYPPDVTHVLVDCAHRDMVWHATPVLAVERFGEPFLGARFAMVGFNGGEPRENVAGVYALPWTHDPGLLTRAWGGMDPLLCKLVAWCTPRELAVRLELPLLHSETESPEVAVTLRNLGPEPVRVALRLDGPGCGRDPIPVEAAPGFSRVPLGLSRRGFGLHPLAAELLREGSVVAEHAVVEYVLPSGAPTFPGYGFSTFWAFPGGRVVEGFRDFCREMQARGCQYVRVNIPWEDVEPEPGRYDWNLPDTMLVFARASGLRLRFWMFPTTRGSGLGDAGVPLWSLREPAIAVDGRRGYFPTLWSPFYRQHYFAMVRAFARRYAAAPELDRMVIDFGNSDFPYGYFYYGGDNTVFDHSVRERDAFRRYLRGRGADVPDDLRVPTPADAALWREYLEFRRWSVQQGIHEVDSLLRLEAPLKVSPDLPGHGAGSIADLSSYGLDAKRRHWTEEPVAESELCRLHNAGPAWGGEAWQVGARYAEYDDALFQSLRLNADYLTLPGVELGLHGDDVARIGFIRRTVMGAERDRPEVALFDGLAWNAWQSLANVGSRLDVEVDLLQPAHRHDFSTYRAVVLPPEPWAGAGTVTGGGGGCLVPRDAAWWRRLRAAVERGTNVLLFPGTVQAEGLPLREALGVPEIRYGERCARLVPWPAECGGGTSCGQARTVFAPGEARVVDAGGQPLLVRCPVGRGAFWFAGYDTQPDSLDGSVCHERDAHFATHTLPRFLSMLEVRPTSLDSGCLNAWKSVVRRGKERFLLAFSHQERTVAARFTVRCGDRRDVAYDQATGERFALSPAAAGGWQLELPLHPRRGRYLRLMTTT